MEKSFGKMENVCLKKHVHDVVSMTWFPDLFQATKFNTKKRKEKSRGLSAPDAPDFFAEEIS